jgi:leader peptidase (prepilin peptidase) / N-methyltransferase
LFEEATKGDDVPALILFPAGLLLGSFVSVVAHRLPRGESWVAGRSHCPGCGAQIAAYDNVPVLSYLMLRGRCRNCGERISPRYPLTEVGLGVLYVGTFLALGDGDLGELALGLVLCTLLVAITLTDLDRQVIPNKIVFAGAVAGVAIVAATHPASLDERVIAALGAGGFLFVVAVLYPRGMGMGDVKLVAMMGIYLGRAIAPALLIAFAAGAVVGIGLIARHGSEARKRAVPFGPFLAFGGVLALWFGDAMVDWYLDEFMASN